MNNRRVDAIYFVAFMLVLCFGYAIARSQDGAEDQVAVEIPDFSFDGLAALEVEAPFEFSYAFVKFARPRAPALALSENTESVRRQLRSALLYSSSLVEVDAQARGAAELAAVDRSQTGRLEYSEE